MPKWYWHLESQLAFLRDVPNTTTFSSRQKTVNMSTGRAVSGLVNLFRRSHSPPEVGAAKAKLAMAIPVARMKMLAWNQPEGVSTTAIILSRARHAHPESLKALRYL